MTNDHLSRFSAIPKAAPKTILGLILAATWLAGCASLETIREFSDPRIGFLVASTTGNNAARATYAGRLADEALKTIRQPLAGTIPGLAAYEQALSREIKVDPSIAGSLDLQAMSDTERQRLTDYFARNPDRLIIVGKAASSEWAAELARVTQAMTSLSDEKARLLAAAEQAVQKKAFDGIPALCDKAEQIDPADSLLRQKLDACRRAWLPGILGAITPDLEKDIFTPAAQIQKAYFETPKSVPAQIDRCLALLDKADQRLADIRAGIPQRADLLQSLKGSVAALERIEEKSASLRGICWNEAMRLMTDRLQYWPAYAYATERNKEIQKLPRKAADILRGGLLGAYANMLPKAMAFYVGKANDRLAEDAYGVALIFCRMSEEMSTFARRMGLPPAAETTTWETRTQASIADCQKRLKSIMSRQIVIHDLAPQGDEGGRLAGLVYDAIAKLSAGQVPAGRFPTLWAVKTERQAKDPGELDYVFDGTISRLSITPRPPQEIKREIIKVGGDLREIPNPLYTPKSELPPTAYSQEVLMYQKTETRQVKEVQLAITLSCRHHGKTGAFLSLNRQWPDPKSELPGVNITGMEVRLDPPFMGPPRISISQFDLTKDPLPKASAAEISSDQHIKDVVLLYARDEVVSRIEALAGAYPVRELMEPGVSRQKLDKKLEAADAFGQCLEYCFQLADMDRAATDTKDPADWLQLKARMLSRIRELSSTLWKAEDEGLRSKMLDIWDLAVSSALNTLKP